jgi:hypothetical protein
MRGIGNKGALRGQCSGQALEEGIQGRYQRQHFLRQTSRWKRV